MTLDWILSACGLQIVEAQRGLVSSSKGCRALRRGKHYLLRFTCAKALKAKPRGSGPGVWEHETHGNLDYVELHGESNGIAIGK